MSEPDRKASGYEPKWQDRLDPFGHLFVNLDDHLESMLQAMPDAELSALQEATTQVTTGNCWCYVYDANPFVQRAILKEQGRRKVLFMDEEDGDA